MPTRDRVYGGLTAEQREDRRREQLLDAGLEIFAAKGWDGATVKDVCRAAGL
ncbi:MAG: TetR/AcrR family transcriptional regulator, partial [Baekduiaceae bacterium]